MLELERAGVGACEKPRPHVRAERAPGGAGGAAAGWWGSSGLPRLCLRAVPCQLLGPLAHLPGPRGQQ